MNMKFTRKCSGVDAFAMVLHALNYCTWPSFKSNVHLKNNGQTVINKIIIRVSKTLYVLKVSNSQDVPKQINRYA